MNFTFFKHGTELESTFKIKTGSKNYAKVINFKTEMFVNCSTKRYSKEIFGDTAVFGVY